MKKIVHLIYFICICSFWNCKTSQKIVEHVSDNEQTILLHEGLQDEVEVIVDHWGIPHIYAKNQEDLFFAQGYHAAKDRLFQFEVWRRQATGTVAELLGERELYRDIGTRLFAFRKDIVTEMNHYHKDGQEIIESYVKGVNAFINEINKTPENLPIEFKLLDIKPGLWTPEVVISRHQGLLGNIGLEVNTARAVSLLGEEKVKELQWFHPMEPDLEIDTAIQQEYLFDDILMLYNAYRKPVEFLPEDIVIAARNNDVDYSDYVMHNDDFEAEDPFSIGSNNWVISGDKTESGFPLMANDPHRRLAVPSLRYMAHLVAPGWNVIGGGEPEIPGISIGHNEFGAWGLTVYRTDAEDLFVYKTNPKNPNEYWYKGAWKSFEIIRDTIHIKNISPLQVNLKYSIHGPVCYEDEDNHIAYAVQCGWLEYGGSPYLASLRMDQSETFEEFRAACNYSNIPGENMVWADREGNIGWQTVGINPYRNTHSGMVPVPGDGRYDWDGYQEIVDRPHLYNPANQMITTSNEDVTPKDYDQFNTVGFSWADPYRGNRVKEVLNSKNKHSVLEMAKLQSDYLSLPAREMIPFLQNLESENLNFQWMKNQLLNWDYTLDAASIPAALYVTLERAISRSLWKNAVPDEAKAFISGIQLKRILEWLEKPTVQLFGANPKRGRDDFIVRMMIQSMEELEKRLGKDRTQWQYGQTAFKHVKMIHPLSNAVSDEVKDQLEVGPNPRGGYGYTVGSTGSADNQPSGGTFRVIIDTGNWDEALFHNSPGQSGDPKSPHYENLFDDWSKDKYLPLYYSRDKIESIKSFEYKLKPNLK